MSLIKKLVALKNIFGFVLVGLFFTTIGGFIVFTGKSDGSLMPLAFMLIGIIVLVGGLFALIKELKRPVEDHAQYNRIDPSARPSDEYIKEQMDEMPEEDFVFHFCGKANQSFIMKDHYGVAVYESICSGITIVKDTEFTFCNHMTGEEEKKMVSHTITREARVSEFFGNLNVSSTFDINGKDVWEEIAAMGYGFRFSMHGLACHYDVNRWNYPAGYCELGGTGLMNPKYKDNPLGKMPTNGIFKVRCRRKDVPGLFLICFALSKTEFSLN